RGPVIRAGQEGLDSALGGGVEALERRHDLTAREDLDPEPPATHLLDDLRELFSHSLLPIERSGEGGRHPPLDLWLGDDVGSFDDGSGARGGPRAARLHDEPPSLHRAVLLHAGGANPAHDDLGSAHPARSCWYAPSATRSHGPTRVWNFWNDAMSPLEVASKQANRAMIWPPG